ncbi:MAG: efflux RND transporter periplasmic adaptor subunit [Bacteroidia bacterium]|jgi:cobalt-zinc-cadmium efflux system membrane fusion protein|nr:efflux RND transporter periplasmic adaptor subunit [Bacteroidia bacterium]
MNKKLFFILPISALLFAGCGSKKEEKIEALPDDEVKLTGEQMKQISLDTARLQEEITDLQLSGRVDFNQDDVLPVFGFASGNVLEVNASLGDHVAKGQVLAIVRSGDLGNYLSQYNQAKGQVALNKRNMDVAEELYKTKVYSQLQVLNAKITYNASVDNLKQYETYLKTYGISDSSKAAPDYKITAPVNGFVIQKSINKGMNLLPGSNNNYFTLSSLSTVWIKANLYEEDLQQVKEGDSVNVQVFALPDTVFKGVISKINYVLDSSSGTLQARIVLNNPGQLLKPNMLAEVKVHIDGHCKAIAVPKDAVVLYENVYYVMVRRRDNVFERKAVKLKNCSGGVCYIAAGIGPGDVVVNKGAIYVLGQ